LQKCKNANKLNKKLFFKKKFSENFGSQIRIL
jgi:hypothetical protein